MPANQITNGASPESTESRSPRVWIFQGSPIKYRLEESLQAETEEYWNLRQHASKVARGDIVLIWLSGNEAGIYVVGEVLDDPLEQSDSPKGMVYWRNPIDGLRVYPRVRVRYNQTLLDRPLSKKYLLSDPALQNLSIFRNPRGTNFPVTASEWLALQAWLSPTETE